MIIPLQHSYKYLHFASNTEYISSIGHPAFSNEPIEKYMISNLKEILNRTQKNGERLILLNKLSEKLLMMLPEEAYKYASIAWNLGRSIKARAQLIKSNLILGAYHRNKQEFETALEHYQNVLNIGLELEDKISIANAYVQVGYMNWRLRRLNKSIISYTKGLELYIEMNNEKLTLSLTKVLGDLHIEIGNETKAEYYFLSALTKQRQFNENLLEESKLLTKLGEAYLLSGQLVKAETNFLKALSHNKATEDLSEVANNSNNLGVVYMKQKRYDHAIDCFNNALKLNHQHSDTRKIAITYHHLGNAYYELEVNDSCIKNYKEALEAYKRIGDNVKVASLMGLLGKIYFRLKKYRKSLLSLKQAISVSSILDDQRIVIECHFYMGKIALKTRDPETAITHFDNCIRKLEACSLQSEFLEVYQEIASCCAQLNQFAEAYKWEKKYNVLLEFKFSNSDKQKSPN